MRRLVILAAAALGCAAPAFSQTQVWECKIQRRIENSKATDYTEAQRATPALRFDFAADPRANKGCLVSPATNQCVMPFTGAADAQGILRLDATAADGTLDLVNIFTADGSFIRIRGNTQWMGKSGDCRKVTRRIALPQ